MNTDESLRKLVTIHQMFGPPDSPFRRVGDFAPLISREFLAAVEIDVVFRSLGKKEKEKVWRQFLAGGEKARRDPPKIKRLKELLGKFELPLDATGLRRIRGFSAKVLALSGKASSWVKKIFGKPLPDKVVVIPYGYPIPWSKSGTRLISSPVLIGMTTGYRDYRSFFDVLLHEILHALVKDRIRKPDRSWFEEALLDYFVPDGILSEKLGLIGKLDLGKHLERVVQSRSYAAEAARKLFPVIEKYYPICGQVNVWEFLRENGLESYLEKR